MPGIIWTLPLTIGEMSALTEIEKKAIELCFIERQIAELYIRKNTLKKELNDFTLQIQRICSTTGKTINSIDSNDILKRKGDDA